MANILLATLGLMMFQLTGSTLTLVLTIVDGFWAAFFGWLFFKKGLGPSSVSGRTIVASSERNWVKRPVLLTILFLALLGSALPQVRADSLVFYGGYILTTCDFWGCSFTPAQGVATIIEVNAETVATGELLAQWISNDVFATCGPIPHSCHWWIQTGLAIGELPDGTFTTIPVFYVESDTVSGVYTFQNHGPVNFGTAHTFQMWDDGTNWHVAIDGSQVYTLSNGYSSDGVSDGEESASIELHEPVGMSLNPTGNGHWSGLQFYCNKAWQNWGASNCQDIWPNSSTYVVNQTCDEYGVQPISIREFTVGGGGVSCASRGGGGCLVCPHPAVPIPDGRLIGPQSGYNPGLGIKPSLITILLLTGSQIAIGMLSLMTYLKIRRALPKRLKPERGAFVPTGD